MPPLRRARGKIPKLTEEQSGPIRCLDVHPGTLILGPSAPAQRRSPTTEIRHHAEEEDYRRLRHAQQLGYVVDRRLQVPSSHRPASAVTVASSPLFLPHPHPFPLLIRKKGDGFRWE
jgi:hypothetical protein